MTESPASSENLPETLEDWQALVRGFEDRAMMLRAYDAAVHALQEHPDDAWLKHRAVLALARSGATETATRRYHEYGLGGEDDEDNAALGARLAKDLVWLASGEERLALSAAAADEYEKVHARTGGYFPGINAATLRLIAGDADEARKLASNILSHLDGLPASEGKEAYYRAASAAEALLILGDEAGAREALGRAVAAHGDDLAALATTRKQLRRVCEVLECDPALLKEMASQPVVVFCGHMISPPGASGRFPAGCEAEAAQAIGRHLETSNAGFGYGALACGADILFAEALLERGAELNLVFPFRIEEFTDISVRNGGPGWEKRFKRCLGRAATVTFATSDSYLGDDHLFAYSSQLAMGLALLRAQYLDTGIEQVALWDGVPSPGPAGTAADVGLWRALGYDQTIIPCPGGQPPQASPAPPGPATGRVNRAMLFGDFKGFSKLDDRQRPFFLREVLGGLAAVMETYESSICDRNTWGDGIYLVFDDLQLAARCALDMQLAMTRLPLREFGLPDDLSLRLGGHFGPVYEGTDPIMRATIIFGAHVNVAARIEPITPEGSVYVTEHFAAGLALDPAREFNCNYVGTGPADKGYGDLAMYLLRRMATA